MLRKYQVVYQGYEPNPNQVVSDPIDFDTANWLACTLQAEIKESDRRENKDKDFFVVEPIFTEVK